MALRFAPVSWPVIEDAIQFEICQATGFADSNVTWAGQASKRPIGQYVSMNLTNVMEAGIDWTDWANNWFSFADLTITSVSGSTLAIPAHGLQTGDGPVRLTWTGTAPAPLSTLINYWVIAVDVDHIRLAVSYLNSVYPSDNSAPIPIALTTAGTGTGKIVQVTGKTERKDQGLVARVRAMWVVTMSIQCFAGPATGLMNPMALLGQVMIRFRTGGAIRRLNIAGIGISDFTPIKDIGKGISMTLFESRAVMDLKFFVAAQTEDYQTYIGRVALTDTHTGITKVISRPDS